VAQPVAVLGDLLDILGDVGRFGLDSGALGGRDWRIAGSNLDIGQDGVAGFGALCGVRRVGLRRAVGVGMALGRGIRQPVQGSRAVRGAAAGIGPGFARDLVVSLGTAVWTCNIRSSNKRRRTRAARLRSVHITTNGAAGAKGASYVMRHASGCRPSQFRTTQHVYFHDA
jgi:hypothetical protein